MAGHSAAGGGAALPTTPAARSPQGDESCNQRIGQPAAELAGFTSRRRSTGGEWGAAGWRGALLGVQHCASSAAAAATRSVPPGSLACRGGNKRTAATLTANVHSDGWQCLASCTSRNAGPQAAACRTHQLRTLNATAAWLPATGQLTSNRCHATRCCAHRHEVGLGPVGEGDDA